MPAMPESPHTAPEGDFAVWELPCRSIVGFGWVGECNALGRGSRGAGDGGGTGRLTRGRVSELI